MSALLALLSLLAAAPSCGTPFGKRSFGGDDMSSKGNVESRLRNNASSLIETQAQSVQEAAYPHEAKFCRPGLRVFDAFVQRSAPLVNSWRIVAADPMKAKYAAVIVEARNDPKFSWAVRSVMHMIGPEWALFVFHGSKNGQYLTEALEPGLGNVSFHPIVFPDGSHPDKLTQNTYGYFMMQKEFWNVFPPNIENILVFQTDSAALRPLGAEELKRYVALDFIGSPWDFRVDLTQLHVPTSETIAKSLRSYFGVQSFLEADTSVVEKVNSEADTPNPFAGNGGFSMRSVKLSKAALDCCNEVDDGLHFEDQIFLKCFRSMGGKVATWQEALSFGIESLYTGQSTLSPFGFHKIWCYLPPQEVAMVLANSELAKQLEHFEDHEVSLNNNNPNIDNTLQHATKRSDHHSANSEISKSVEDPPKPVQDPPMSMQTSAPDAQQGKGSKPEVVAEGSLQLSTEKGQEHHRKAAVSSPPPPSAQVVPAVGSAGGKAGTTVTLKSAPDALATDPAGKAKTTVMEKPVAARKVYHTKRKSRDAHPGFDLHVNKGHSPPKTKRAAPVFQNGVAQTLSVGKGTGMWDTV